MPLTQEEKEELRLEKSNASYHCKSTWATILQLKKLLSQYQSDHYKWCRRFEAADLTLAEDEKLVMLPGPGKGKKVKNVEEITEKLSREQVLEICVDLNINVEGKLDFEE